MCRLVQVVNVELRKDRGRKVEHKSASVVVGFAQLPDEGGMLDQGVWLMSMFEQFRNGENTSASKKLK